MMQTHRNNKKHEDLARVDDENRTKQCKTIRKSGSGEGKYQRKMIGNYKKTKRKPKIRRGQTIKLNQNAKPSENIKKAGDLARATIEIKRKQCNTIGKPRENRRSGEGRQFKSTKNNAKPWENTRKP